MILLCLYNYILNFIIINFCDLVFVDKLFNVCDLSNDKIWMRYAIMLADCAESFGEVAVGAVLVLNGRIIGEGWNSTITHHDPTAHAEIIALRKGGQEISNYRLLNTVLYVTMEPCMMCFGAMIHARIFRLVFGAPNTNKRGGVFSKKGCLNRFVMNHQIIYTGGVLQELCSSQIINFFYKKRKKKK